MFADPKAIRDPRRAAVAAARAFGLEPNFLYRDFTNRKLGFVYVARKADPIAAAMLEKQNIAGLGFYSEEKRVYPQQGVAAQVVGFAGTDNRGLEGLERSLDGNSRGRRAARRSSRTRSAGVVDVVKSRPESRGENVTLTIDHQIQANAESILADTVQPVACEGRLGDRARSAYGPDPGDGERTGVRLEPLRVRRIPISAATAR